MSIMSGKEIRMRRIFKEDGKTVDENSDEYTADEKDGKSFMSDGARNGK